MKIRIDNHICYGGKEIEQTSHVYSGVYHQKGSSEYVVYQNDEAEKVVVKWDQQALVMTRFSTPPFILRFEKGKQTSTHLPTALGGQLLVVSTSELQCDNHQIKVSYDLKTKEQKELAQYDCTISWEV